MEGETSQRNTLQCLQRLCPSPGRRTLRRSARAASWTWAVWRVARALSQLGRRVEFSARDRALRQGWRPTFMKLSARTGVLRWLGAGGRFGRRLFHIRSDQEVSPEATKHWSLASQASMSEEGRWLTCRDALQPEHAHASLRWPVINLHLQWRVAARSRAKAT